MEMEIDDRSLEIENRIKNLVWTISGDYSMDVHPDAEAYVKAPDTTLYNAVRQGAFALLFDQNAYSLYLVKKIFCGASEGDLTMLSQIICEQAVSKRLEQERRGIRNLRKKCYEEIRDMDYEKLVKSRPGRLKLAYLRYRENEEDHASGEIRQALELLIPACKAEDTAELIHITDQIYNSYIDHSFDKKGITLADVLSVTIDELKEYSWRDFLSEDFEEESFEQYLAQISEDCTSFDQTETKKDQESEKEKEDHQKKRKAMVIDEETLSRMHDYVERNFGKTYLSPAQERSCNYHYCKGIHSACSVYFTEGILKNPVQRNYQYSYAERQKSNNIHAYHDDHRAVKQNIRTMTELMKKSLILREEVIEIESDHGMITPSRLWQIGRSQNAQIFHRELKADSRDIVVDILIDASGSQRPRQSQVVLQGYILAESLSNLGIPFRIMTYCTFWDYTILHRMRDYDDPREKNQNLFEYMTSSNNRDGLAIRAAGEALMKRPEEQKLLIILSDGKPNDRIVNRTGTRTPKPYFGEYAVRDTATEVRRLRQMGVSVLGVFAGDETELRAEKKIFGKDFAYIRNINNFSKIVSSYLQKQIEG